MGATQEFYKKIAYIGLRNPDNTLVLNVPLYVKVSEVNKNGMTHSQEEVMHRISEVMIRRFEKQLSAYFANLLTGDPQDKAYQKKRIDGLVTQVIIEDGGNIVTYLNLMNGKEVARISLENTKNAVSSVFCVQTLSSMVPKAGLEPA